MDNPWLIAIVTTLVGGLLVEIIVDKRHRVSASIAIVVVLLISIPIAHKLSSNSKVASNQVPQSGTSSLTQTPVTTAIKTTTPNLMDSQQTQVVNKTITTTAIADQSIDYSDNSQNINLTATVTSSGGGTINEGTITFTIKDSHGITVGVPVWGIVIKGNTSQVYSLPGGTGAGLYVISADYSGGNHLMISNGIGSLTVNKAKTFITITKTSSTATATVTTGDFSIVNQGTITFKVSYWGGIGPGWSSWSAPVVVTVTHGIASAVFSGGLANGMVNADYSGGDNFQGSSARN